jgi:predicted O-methyltransferase YrrM
MDLSFEMNRYIEGHTRPEEGFLKELERETHLSCINPRMLSGHVQGKMLYMLCKMIRPMRVLELGTFTGYSAISMALALGEGAKLHTVEVHDELEDIILKYIHKARLENIITLHIGKAMEIVPALNEKFDLVFIDADKREYPAYYNMVFEMVNPGGYIIADNILWNGKVVDPESAISDPQTMGIVEFNRMVQSDERVENVVFPFRDGMMVVRKK